jgi:ribosomal protein L2
MGWPARDTQSPAGQEVVDHLIGADASGHLINAGYTDHARAKGKKEGQTVQIVYDPRRPVSIARVDGDPRVVEAFFLALGSAVSVGLAVYFAVRAFG